MVVIGNHISRGTSVCILAMVLCLASRASGEYESREMSNGGPNDRSSSNDFSSCTEGKCVKRTMKEITNGMWFGPRLGRRRRSEVDKQEINSEIEALANVLGNERWAFITIPASEKRQPTQFTPRLGRGSEEDPFSYADAIDRYEFEESDQPLPPIFAPRLGRRLPWAPSPRLGRQLRGAMRKI
ncbi:PBAN-type neuropeptides [Ooceraea biroi]|nr:PBAN-type neuropeptides [Ooceraea biroi]